MKALDTPALLAILEGRREATWILKEIAGGEVCTTEINMFELEALVLADRRSDRQRRMAALQRLRHRISVFPLDEKAAGIAARLAAPVRGGSSPVAALILGTVAANGATELLTSEAGRFPDGDSPVAIHLLRSGPSKRTGSRK